MVYIKNMLTPGSTVKNKALTYFFLNEESRTYINELARLIEADPKNVYRMLLQLENQGLLVSEFKGKERYFYLNKKNPLYKEYKNIFLKTTGIEAILKNKLKTVSGLKEAYIFGSYAQGKYGPESDIDILLVGTHKSLSAQKVLHNIQKQTVREINTVNITPQELKVKKQHGDQFITGIFSHKTIKIL
ncbi:MAG: nucleotidyltransferase domain-containing protein [Candidatus Omnitrophota bacterium]|jgi:predicted nucleotidyltransferase